MISTNLPVILLKNNILFPYSEIRLEIVYEKDKLVIDRSIRNNDSYVLLINLSDPLEESPNIGDLPDIGVVGKIKSKIELGNGNYRIVILGMERVGVVNYLENHDDYLESFVASFPSYVYDEVEARALKRILIRDLNQYIESSSVMSNSVLGRLDGVEDVSKITDIIAFELSVDYEKKLKYLKIKNPFQRMKVLIDDLNSEIETVRMENEIEHSLRERIDDSQREYLLREKIRMIKEELGESTIRDKEIEDLKRKIQEGDFPLAVQKRLDEELKRYILSTDASPEVTIIRTYLDWLLNLPWKVATPSGNSRKKVIDTLNDSHYGLEKVKSRIIEYVSVMEVVPSVRGNIICLVGPPGVGKTTLARSIADALGKKFVKISVGGVSDEAEIVGHRRTYLGANPGKIIQGMKKARVNNPVFLIDEVDKLIRDYHGDPASSLLEVLDREGNCHFCDNYIEEEFDLSNVLFILTANDKSKIPVPLLDRLEIIELSSYTNYDKKEIARKYLIPKLFKEYKIRDYNVSIHDDTVVKIITDYTKEAGARELGRKIEDICRKIITRDIHDKVIKASDLKEFLGSVKYYHTKRESSNQTGVINALAYTVYGGDILKVSATHYRGEGKILVTGSVGKVMEESVKVALSYIRSNASNFGIDSDIFMYYDFHVHIEEGAIPKDGPSAGGAIVTALLSLLSSKVIDSDVSMTGEMTLRGRILPIGGLKEKLIGASVNGIKRVLIPNDNRGELEDIPDEILDKVEVVLVRDYLDIYYYLFGEEEKKEEEAK